jgi:hypothetical protein
MSYFKERSPGLSQRGSRCEGSVFQNPKSLGVFHKEREGAQPRHPWGIEM